ncbi:hypothetical protein [Synechococcus sp. CS-1328]|uniref:hypothetical protein n=1 Tax=Synechococcus sp. CS-1328 TaxID=2847976 RepID=UPI00223B35E9|nr:hypothetical protein [Synechococcus sp. CS-1328]MCT0223698.1 hypothetical protein [Synechococcus sp. CS-1328]
MVLLPDAGLAADAVRCGALLDRRNALAEQAMAEEIRLAGAVRDRLCPALNRRADAANANPDSAAAGAPQEQPFDYGGYVECRHRAEAELARSRAVLYRNRLGFPFYTEAGADLARQSDRLVQERLQVGCPGQS